MPTGQFQTVKDVADMLKVGEPTVRRWIKDGELRAIDIGRGWRIAPDDLSEFLHQHESRPHGNGEKDPGTPGFSAAGARSESAHSSAEEREND